MTTKTDVYAFGTLLIELITGKQARDEKIHTGGDLVKWFKTKLKYIKECGDDLLLIMDTNLIVNDDTQQSLEKAIEMASYCTSRNPDGRPTMETVVTRLQPVILEWNPFQLSDDESEANPEELARLARGEFTDPSESASHAASGATSSGTALDLSVKADAN